MTLHGVVKVYILLSSFLPSGNPFPESRNEVGASKMSDLRQMLESDQEILSSPEYENDLAGTFLNQNSAAKDDFPMDAFNIQDNSPPSSDGTLVDQLKTKQQTFLLSDNHPGMEKRNEKATSSLGEKDFRLETREPLNFADNTKWGKRDSSSRGKDSRLDKREPLNFSGHTRSGKRASSSSEKGFRLDKREPLNFSGHTRSGKRASSSSEKGFRLDKREPLNFSGHTRTGKRASSSSKRGFRLDKREPLNFSGHTRSGKRASSSSEKGFRLDKREPLNFSGHTRSGKRASSSSEKGFRLDKREPLNFSGHTRSGKRASSSSEKGFRLDKREPLNFSGHTRTGKRASLSSEKSSRIDERKHIEPLSNKNRNEDPLTIKIEHKKDAQLEKREPFVFGKYGDEADQSLNKVDIQNQVSKRYEEELLKHYEDSYKPSHIDQHSTHYNPNVRRRIQLQKLNDQAENLQTQDDESASNDDSASLDDDSELLVDESALNDDITSLDDDNELLDDDNELLDDDSELLDEKSDSFDMNAAESNIPFDEQSNHHKSEKGNSRVHGFLGSIKGFHPHLQKDLGKPQEEDQFAQ